MTQFYYSVFGLTVASEIELPELWPGEAGSPVDVVVRCASVGATGTEPGGLTVLGENALLNIPQVALYRIDAGREIVVEAAPEAADRNVRLFLLGSAFGAILHQRDLLPLHANAIVVDGRAIGFLGHPGAGKSTTAAWFHDRGYPVLADDVCAITFDPAGRPLAHPGIPRLRLWREALEASGRDASDYESSFDDTDKYNVPTRAHGWTKGVPLDHLYLLAKADDPKDANISRLRGAAAVEALVANTYRGAYVPLMARTGAHLAACARLAGSVPLFLASRAWGFAELDDQGRQLEEHARSVVAGGAAR